MLSKVAKRIKVKRRIRKKISGTSAKPRLSVFRSNKAIYAQIIDDLNGHTLMAASSREKGFESAGSKIDIAKAVGKKLAEKATEKGIDQVVFDRGGYLYHGRVKALAEGAREGGLQF